MQRVGQQSERGEPEASGSHSRFSSCPDPTWFYRHFDAEPAKIHRGPQRKRIRHRTFCAGPNQGHSPISFLSRPARHSLASHQAAEAADVFGCKDQVPLVLSVRSSFNSLAAWSRRPQEDLRLKRFSIEGTW